MEKAKKIVFLCKRNIVRSYFAEVVFSALYPDFEFDSAGVISFDPKQDLSWRSNFLSNWGFTDPVREPKLFESMQHELSERDIIVLLDSELPALLSSYISQNPKVLVLSPFDQLPEWAYTFDPIDMGASEIKLSVSRVIFTAHKILWSILNLPTSNETAIFWESVESFHKEIKDFCNKEVAKGNNILFLDPISSDYISTASFKINLFRSDHVRPLISTDPAIWMPEYEHPFTEKLLLSKAWSVNLVDDANAHPLKVISGPLRDGNRYLTLPLLIGSPIRNYEICESAARDLKPTPL